MSTMAVAGMVAGMSAMAMAVMVAGMSMARIGMARIGVTRIGMACIGVFRSNQSKLTQAQGEGKGDANRNCYKK